MTKRGATPQHLYLDAPLRHEDSELVPLVVPCAAVYGSVPLCRHLSGISVGLTVVLKVDGPCCIVLSRIRLLDGGDDKLTLQIRSGITATLECLQVYALTLAPESCTLLEAVLCGLIEAEALSMSRDAHLCDALACEESLLLCSSGYWFDGTLLRLSVVLDIMGRAPRDAAASYVQQDVGAVLVVTRRCRRRTGATVSHLSVCTDDVRRHTCYMIDNTFYKHIMEKLSYLNTRSVRCPLGQRQLILLPMPCMRTEVSVHSSQDPNRRIHPRPSKGTDCR